MISISRDSCPVGPSVWRCGRRASNAVARMRVRGVGPQGAGGLFFAADFGEEAQTCFWKCRYRSTWVPLTAPAHGRLRFRAPPSSAPPSSLPRASVASDAIASRAAEQRARHDRQTLPLPRHHAGRLRLAAAWRSTATASAGCQPPTRKPVNPAPRGPICQQRAACDRVT